MHDANKHRDQAAYGRLDVYWKAVADFIRRRLKAGDRLMAPADFAGCFPGNDLHSYSEYFSGGYQWIVLHKDCIDEAEEKGLIAACLALEPVFANEVFVVFAERARARPIRSSNKHYRSFIRSLSDQFQPGRLLEKRAFAQVEALYRGLLGREPDPGGLEFHLRRLIEGGNLENLAMDMILSDEFQRRCIGLAGRDLARDLCLMLLGRQPDEATLTEYSSQLAMNCDASSILRQLLSSREFLNRFRGPCEGSCWVFLHAGKTAGTSVQTLLSSFFPSEAVFKEHDNSLFRRRQEELARYTVFAGHFDYDSLAYIPKAEKRLLTFVREPSQRLYSHYYFRRAAEPGHPIFDLENELANELDLRSFLDDIRVRGSAWIWNHMTFIVMGERIWTAWRRQIFDSADAAFVQEFIDFQAAPAIRERLREFSFIGIQEEFDLSIRILCRVLDRPEPETAPKENDLDGLLKSGVHFKRQLEKEPLTDEAISAMEVLNQLDYVVYGESKKYFAEQVAQYGSIP